VARWTFDSVRAALTPQRLQAMWLRRFRSEGGGAFRTSRVIDRLSRSGVSALTLQDRDVQLSLEQRRNRLAPIFWVLFLPVAVAIGAGAVTVWRKAPEMAQEMASSQKPPPTDNVVEAIAQAFMLSFVSAIAAMVVVLFILVALAAALVATAFLITLIASVVGPIGAALSRHRDDFKSLPRLVERIRAGKRSRGAVVLRISDANWREAVRTALAAADVAIIDLSSVTDHILWEIGEAVKTCGANGLVFIRREGEASIPSTVRDALGREPDGVVYYPAKHGSKRAAQRFADALRDAIYDAADRARGRQPA
jgi:uncharacterized membrane protein